MLADALTGYPSQRKTPPDNIPGNLQNASIHKLFEAQVEQTPDAVAVVFESKYLTYRELNYRANQLANYLKAQGVEPEVLVGICMERSLDMVVGLLGILKAGGAYLPLDRAYPKERLGFILEDSQVPVLLTQERLVPMLGDRQARVVLIDADWGIIARESAQNLTSNVRPDNLAYAIYTSGSTGTPKGVEIEHRGLLNLVFWHQQTFAVSPSDRATQLAGPAFDASVWELWPYLTAGASIYIADEETRISPVRLRDWLVASGITITFLPTPLAESVLLLDWPQNLALRTLLTGGDKLHNYPSPSLPFELVNNYGPTENTVVTTSSSVPPKERSDMAPSIGRPIANTQVYLLNARLQPVPTGEPGELYIGGAGLARGYLNRPELTAERFIPNPFSNEPSSRLYKTGDLARYLPDGNIEFLGRIDDQVKIRGFRIELGEIEAALWQHPTVREAVVVAREDAPGHKHLAGYVAPSQEPAPSFSELRHFLKQKLPEYMVPSTFTVLDTLPLTPNGKVDRRALPAPESTRPELEAAYIAPRTLLEEQLADIWAEVLGVEKVGIQDNLLELGGNSLLAAQLIVRLQETFDIDLPARCLFESPTVMGLAQIIEALRRESSAAVFASTTPDLKAEVVLDPEIYPRGTLVDAIEPHHIFLTGATGFLGAFLLDELLQKTQAKIYCLVRSSNEERGLRKLQANLEKYLLWDRNLSSRIIPIPGDLSQPLLGLSVEQFERLANCIDTIYHSGAEVNYVKPYSLHKGANVTGTQEVLRLACRGQLKPVHYLSTVAVFGEIGFFTGVKVIREDEDLDCSEKYLYTDIGYSQSKWVAEKLVWVAKSRGMPISIYRPGFIMGHSQTGVNNLNDFTSRMIKGCIQLGYFPDLIDQKKEFIPVDYASQAIVHLSNQRESLGKVFHIVPPPAKNVDLISFFELICSFGYPLKKVPYSQWKEEFLKYTKQSQDNALFPLLSPLTEKIYQSLTMWELYQNMPDYDCQNTLDGLTGTSIVCPPMDVNLLNTYFSYFIRSGFL